MFIFKVCVRVRVSSDSSYEHSAFGACGTYILLAGSKGKLE